MITFYDWHSFRAKLIWAYEGPPSRPQGTYTSLGLKMWYLLQGGVNWVCEDHSGRAEAGNWLMLPFQSTAHEFDPGSRILSIRVIAVWRGGRPIVEVPYPVKFQGSAHPDLEPAARRVIALTERISAGDIVNWHAFSGSLDDFLLLDEAVMEWMRVVVRCARSRNLEFRGGEITDPRVSDALHQLESTPLDRKFDRHAFSRSMGLSYSQLSRLFNDQLGCTPAMVLEQRRIEHAMRLLHQRTLLVKQIAFTLGFTESTYFSRWFKRHTGMSPGEYRETADIHG